MNERAGPANGDRGGLSSWRTVGEGSFLPEKNPAGKRMIKARKGRARILRKIVFGRHRADQLMSSGPAEGERSAAFGQGLLPGGISLAYGHLGPALC